MKWKSKLEIFALCIIYFTLKTIRTSEYVESKTTKKDNIMVYSVLQGTINFIGIFQIIFWNKMKVIILLIFLAPSKHCIMWESPTLGSVCFQRSMCSKDQNRSKILSLLVQDRWAWQEGCFAQCIGKCHLGL